MSERSTYIPVTTPQIKAIHAMIRRLGVHKEDIYAVYRDQRPGAKSEHIHSLKDLSRAQASQLIDRLKARCPASWQGAPRPRPAPRAPSGPRLATDATTLQRSRIAHLFHRLGWSPEMAAGWLARRFGVSSLQDEHFARHRASDAINQLERALSRHGPVVQQEATQ